MCGLVGLFGNITQHDKQLFRTLLMVDTIRGHHSTGVAVVDKNGRWDLFKSIGTPWDMFEFAAQMERYDNTFFVREGDFKPESFFFTTKGGLDNHGDARLLMGHNRAATVGRIEPQTAHPFAFEHIIGAHNGTLGKFYQKYEGNKLFEVDSQVMFHELNRTQNIHRLWKELNGAAAVTVWHHESEKIYFARNYQRPLWFIRSADNKRMMWASQKEFILFALSVHSVRSQWQWENIEEFTANQLYSWSFDEKKNTLIEDQKRKLETPVFTQAGPTLAYPRPALTGPANNANSSENKSAKEGHSGGGGVGSNSIDLDSIFEKLDHSRDPFIKTFNQKGIDYAKAFQFDIGKKAWVCKQAPHIVKKYSPDATKGAYGYYRHPGGNTPRYYVKLAFTDLGDIESIEYPALAKLGPQLAKFSVDPVLHISLIHPVKFGNEHYYGPFDLQLMEGWKRAFPHHHFWWDPDLRQFYTYGYPTVDEFKESLNEFNRHFLAQERLIHERGKEEEEQYPYHDGSLLDADEFKDVLEGLGGCPNCGRIPPREVWKSLEWEGPNHFHCAAISCQNYLTLCNSEADSKETAPKQKDVSLHHLPTTISKAVH